MLKVLWKKKSLILIITVGVLTLLWILFLLIESDRDYIRKSLVSVSIRASFPIEQDSVVVLVDSAQKALIEAEKIETAKQDKQTNADNVDDFLNLCDTIVRTYIKDGVVYSLDMRKLYQGTGACCATYVSDCLYQADLITRDMCNANASLLARSLFKAGWEINYDFTDVHKGDIMFSVRGTTTRQQFIDCMKSIANSVEGHTQIMFDVTTGEVYSVGSNAYSQQQPRTSGVTVDTFVCSFRLLKGV